VPSFYQLRVANQIIVLFPKPGEKIRIEGDSKDLISTLKIDGSHDTEQITKLIEMLNDAKTQLDSLAVRYENASDITLKTQLNSEYQDVLEKHRKSSIAYLLTNYNSLSCVYALYQQYQPGYYVFYKTMDIQFFKIVSDSLSKYHPGSKHVEALKVYTANLINNYNTKKILQSSNASVDVLPAIRLPDVSGDTTTLYSMKGKYVLLSFWTSKNQVCINQNLELKKIYAKYGGKNFEIFQVAFDNSRESWQRAVRYDELPWISVIDELYPNSPIGGNYNVTQLPANYLIDKDNSSILGKNLTPAQLQDKLQDLYN
jgi:peroxiredoxin